MIAPALVSLLMAVAPHVGRSAHATAFVHVTVIDGTGAPARSNQTVIVTGRRITALGDSAHVVVPDRSTVIEGRDKYLIPGLWDMHGHLTDATAAAFPRLVRNGVTGVRDMGGDLGQIDRWRDEIARGVHLGPHIVRAGPFVDGPKPGAPYRVTVTTADEARRAVDSLQLAGVDFIKVHNKLPRDAFFALLAEARNRHLPVAVHLPHGIGIAEASDSGAASLEHIEMLTESAAYGPGATAKTMAEALDASSGARGDSLFARLARNGTWYVPTLVAYRRGFELWGNRPDATARRRVAFQRFLDFTGAMFRAGVPIMAGTDFTDFTHGVLPGIDLHEELALLVEAGLTPMEAIEAATSGPARFLGTSDSLGTIEKGKVADLVLLDGDPIDNINNTRLIDTVVLGGVLVHPADVR